MILLQTLKVNFFLLFNIKEFKNSINYLSLFLEILNLNVLLYILNYINNNNITSSSNNYLSLLIYRINEFNILIFKVSIKFFCSVICFDNNFIFFKTVCTSFLHFIICVSVSFIII